MKHTNRSSLSALLTVGSAVLATGASFTAFMDVAHAQASAERSAAVGGALPGGAILSARSVAVAPVAGGTITAAPLAADGAFSVTDLAPGVYRLALTSTTVPRQTQGATFGEKVNAGLHAAGSALSQGAARGKTSTDGAATARSSINGINGGMPNRLSMSVTTAKRTQQVVVDETAVEVEVGADGVLAGRVSAP